MKRCVRPHATATDSGSTELSRLILSATAIGAGLALAWFALTLLGLGRFCFEHGLFTALRDSEALRPDCFVIGVNGWANPKFWLLSNAAVTCALSLLSFFTAYGFFRNRGWAWLLALVCTLAGVAMFVALAVALSQFRTLGLVSATTLGLAAVFLFCWRRPINR